MAKPRPCVQCGVIFLPEFPKGAARTCSDECSQARRKATANSAAKAYYRRNLQVSRAKSRANGRRDPAKTKALWQAWSAKNRDRINAHKRTRYAAQREATP